MPKNESGFGHRNHEMDPSTRTATNAAKLSLRVLFATVLFAGAKFAYDHRDDIAPQHTPTLELTPEDAEFRDTDARAHVTSFVTVEITKKYGRTLYHTLKAVMMQDPEFQDLTSDQQLVVINAAIGLSRQKNQQDLDNFNELVGEKLFLPTQFEVTLLDSGKTYEFDLSQEWPAYIGVIEKPEQSAEGDFSPSSEEIIKSLKAYDQEDRKVLGFEAARDRLQEIKDKLPGLFSSPVTRPILTALDAFPSRERAGMSDIDRQRAKVKQEIIDLLLQVDPQDLGRLGILEGMTIDKLNAPAMADLEDNWEYKLEELTRPSDEPAVSIIARGVDRLDHSMSFSDWVDIVQAQHGALTVLAKKFKLDPELVKYAGPEVLLATVHAEFFSELDGPTFAKLIPVLFKGYNIPFGPAVNDKELSSGTSQIIRTTLESLANEFHKVIVENRDKYPGLRDVVVPGHDPDVGNKSAQIAQAMVLTPESAVFWNYFVALEHADAGFEILMENRTFREKWEAASDTDKSLFLSALMPLSVNGGEGTSRKSASFLLEQLENNSRLDLVQLADLLPRSTKRPTASRGARVGIEAAEALDGFGG